MSFTRGALLPLLFLLLPNSNPAQEPTSAQPPASAHPRPKIGLALEGGGALGLAHIGVLKWFEQHHIPVDYIAGTSMGGLVGGFYASGKSAEEIEQLVSGVDWSLVLGGGTPYENSSFRRKEDSRAVPNSIRVGFKHGPSLPSALNSGHQVSLLIDREILPYSELKSFDDLPIPFRCVATELVSGKGVVFQNGSLASAMRATMSLPGVFAPVRDGDRLYVDGGLVNNLPTDVVRSMGADIVIGVHLQISPVTANEIQSAFNVLNRSVEVVVSDNEIRGLSGADIVINVDVRKFTSLDYHRSAELVTTGVHATQERARVLEPQALDAAAWSDYQHQQQLRKHPSVGTPQFIKVEGTSPGMQKNFEAFLNPLVGKPFHSSEVDTYLTRLTGIGRFDSASYRAIRENGQDGLLVTMHERYDGPPFLQPAFEVNGAQAEDVTFSLGARLTFLDIAGYRSEWRTDVQFGNTYGFATELYKPFTSSIGWFIAPRLAANDASVKFFIKADPEADYKFGRASIGADLGYAFSRFTELRVGYDFGYLDTHLRLGTPEFDEVKGRTGAARLRLLTDHTDDPVIPRRGYRAELNFRWVDTSPGAPEAFPVLQLNAEYFQPVSRLGSVFMGAQGGSTFGSSQTGIPQFFLGAPSELSAYGLNEIRGNQFFLGHVGYLHDLFVLPPFLGKSVYAVGSFEIGKMYAAPRVSRLPGDVAAGIIAETALGPIFVGGSIGDTGHHKWYFQLGRVF